MMRRMVVQIILAVLLVSCRSSGKGTAISTAPGNWQDVPIMPGVVASTDAQSLTIYHYSIKTDMQTVERFYDDEMKISGWEFLGKGDTSTRGLKALALWFAKGGKVVTIDLWQINSTTYVSIIPEP